MKVLPVLFALWTCAASAAQPPPPDSTRAKDPPRIAPIPLEVLGGNRGLVFQLIVSSRLSPSGRFGFFHVTTFQGDYATVNQRNDYATLNFLTASVWKGFSVNAGTALTADGFTPTAALQYFFANQKFLVVFLPRFDLTKTYNFSTVGLVEYKPRFNRTWGLYTRAQAVYSHNTKEGHHANSSAWYRVGVSYKNVQVGVGGNVDWVGAEKTMGHNVGIFVRTELF